MHFTFAALPLCVPGTMSESGNALMGPCSECLDGFYQVSLILIIKTNK